VTAVEHEEKVDATLLLHSNTRHRADLVMIRNCADGTLI
jgi:hypothetical protein